MVEVGLETTLVGPIKPDLVHAWFAFCLLPLRGAKLADGEILYNLLEVLSS